MKMAIVVITLAVFFLVSLLAAQFLGDVSTNGTIDIVDTLLTALFYVGIASQSFRATRFAGRNTRFPACPDPGCRSDRAASHTPPHA